MAPKTTRLMINSSKMVFIFQVAILVPFISALVEESGHNITGFSVDLIHRDSPESPFYDPSLSPTQSLVNSIRRSTSRRHLGQSPAVDLHGDYFVKYSIGSPPVTTFGLMDTSTDFIWTQCLPCQTCFHQTLGPLFDPAASSTYHTLGCTAPECTRSNPYTHCNRRKTECIYVSDYGNKTLSKGVLSTDVFSLVTTAGGTTTRIPSVVFGCGHTNVGAFLPETSGVVGLGGGPNSLITQLGPLARGRFSYCLVQPGDKKSGAANTLNFGDNAVVEGIYVPSTPLVAHSDPTLYRITLNGFSVGYQAFLHNESASKFEFEEGNMVVDTTTPEILLPLGSYADLRSAVQGQVKLKQIKDPTGVLDLCWYTRRQIDIDVWPIVVFHFQGGDVSMDFDNIFRMTTPNCVCLAVQSIGTNPGVYGYLAQTNYLMGFDLEKRLLHFKPMGCSP